MPSVHSKPARHPLKNFDLKKAYENLLVDEYRIDPSTEMPIDNKTTDVHNEYDASQDMHEASLRITDIKKLCEGAVTILTDLKTGKKRSKEVEKFIINTIFPALNVAADIVQAGAKRASPIAYSDVAHKG